MAEIKTLAPYKITKDSPWCCWVEVVSPNHTVGQYFINVRSVTLKGLACEIAERSPKSFQQRQGRTYTLVEGPDAEPGKNLSVKGMFTWNPHDGDEHFFREEGRGRVWKTVPWGKETKKE